VSYFDSIADRYFDLYRADSPGGYALRERKARVLELMRGVKGRVLDVGCGPGVMVEDVLRLGCDFWGVDGSPQMIDQCRRRFRSSDRAHFAVGDARRLLFRDGFFDAVVCVGAIDRIPDYRTALQEMMRVLRPGGTLVVSFPNLLSPYAAWKNFAFYPAVAVLRPLYYTTARRSRPASLPFAFAKLYTRRAATRLLASLGADVQQLAYFHFNPFLPPLDELFPALALRLIRRLERLRAGGLRWLGIGFVARATRR